MLRALLLLTALHAAAAPPPRSILDLWAPVEPTVGAPKAISAECRRHLNLYEISFLLGIPWASQMYDATTKVPDGFGAGNTRLLGMYDECLRVDGPQKSDGSGLPQFTGKFCRVKFTSYSLPVGQKDAQPPPGSGVSVSPGVIGLGQPEAKVEVPSWIPLEWSVCAPSSCGDEGVSQFAASHYYRTYGSGLVVTLAPVPNSCYHRGDTSRTPDNGAAWAVGSCLLILAVVVAGCTLVESCFLHRDGWPQAVQAAVTSFSLRTNLRQLFAKARPGSSLTCLDGVRVLSMAWIILGHKYLTHAFMPSINGRVIFEEFLRNWTSMLVLNSYLAVDTFFFLSGLLLAYVVCNDNRRGRVLGIKNVPSLYLYRYLRLTPSLLVMVMVTAWLVPSASHGPSWEVVLNEASLCRRNWWAALLYVNNYVENQQQCVGQTWYLSVDMQLFWLSPLLLLPLVRWPRPSLFAILVLILASAAATFGVTYAYDLPWSGGLMETDYFEEFWSLVYVNTPMRASPYLVGVALGHVLSEAKVTPRSLPRWSVVAAWAASAGGCLAVLFTLTIPYQEDFQYDRLSAAFYAALHRPAWALGLAWLVLACSTGHGGMVNSFLSLRVWQPLSKLSYCAFLLHLTVMLMEASMWRVPQYFSTLEVVHGFLGDLLLMALPTLALYLVVEAPVNSLLRKAFNKGAPRALKDRGNAVEEPQDKEKVANE